MYSQAHGSIFVRKCTSLVVNLTHLGLIMIKFGLIMSDAHLLVVSYLKLTTYLLANVSLHLHIKFPFVHSVYDVLIP